MWEENKFFPPSNPGRLAHIFVVSEADPVEVKSRFISVFIISIKNVILSENFTHQFHCILLKYDIITLTIEMKYYLVLF
jgi:hypothetical protein